MVEIEIPAGGNCTLPTVTGLGNSIASTADPNVSTMSIQFAHGSFVRLPLTHQVMSELRAQLTAWEELRAMRKKLRGK
jgi:hypothetical protein